MLAKILIRFLSMAGKEFAIFLSSIAASFIAIIFSLSSSRLSFVSIKDPPMAKIYC